MEMTWKTFLCDGCRQVWTSYCSLFTLPAALAGNLVYLKGAEPEEEHSGHSSGSRPSPDVLSDPGLVHVGVRGADTHFSPSVFSSEHPQLERPSVPGMFQMQVDWCTM